MNDYEQNLQEYMKSHSIVGDHLIFDQSCHSVAEAAEAVGADSSEFVKNICMIGPKGELILAIVKGEDRASTTRVGKALSIERPRVAVPEEILQRTGYPCGGTPSFGFEATFLIDPKVMEKDHIYTGGGSQQSLVKIHSKELQKANSGKIVRIRK